MDTYTRARSSHTKPRVFVKKSFGEGVLLSVKSLLQSRKELCSLSTEDCLSQKEHNNFIEITFLGFTEETEGHMQELAAVSAELPDILKSLQLCTLNENEVIFLKDTNKPLERPDVPRYQNHLSGVLCVMRLSPSFPRTTVDSIFTLLNKYATGVRYAMEANSVQKHHPETSHTEDDDTNQSVSSIEDDFVTAFEHLDEEEPSKTQNAGISHITPRSHCDAASQTIPSHCLEAIDSKIIFSSFRRKSSAKSSASLINILELKELTSSVKSSVTTSISDPWESSLLHTMTFGSEDALQVDDKSSIRDVNICAVPDTPPPTPLVPLQTSSERNLRKLTKKLKGELAKQFAPATPPSTPYNPAAAGLSETEHDSLGKEEFMLKLMRSLSEEVESSDDEEHSEMLEEKVEHSERTVEYADHLASRIISMATEMAASHLDDKTAQREADKRLQLNVQSKRCAYTAFINIPEETLNSLWNYAGDMAGKVISEAKKMVVTAAIEKAERELSNTSLAADSGIGQDGISFAESLTTEIMTSAMTNISHAVNMSSVGRDGVHSAESIVSQQMSLSIGEDSTGSWSNLSFEDEHADESSSFLHLSDSDGTEDKEEEPKDTVEGLEDVGKTLLIVNTDMEPSVVDPQLRMALQWLAASEAGVAELHFHDTAMKELMFLSKRLRERDWKVGDLLQAVQKYCEMMEKASDGERGFNKPLFGWLRENV
ncbi:A-kinase anchor protein 11 isoform C [Alligator mississippiensis]|uniref:A-kinase anchor protein 11 isoform C n=1 Tax=Alligator mississippiensis TaxID=8496 RepID=A0A151MHM8_ALLMI|nr:A-kinase anchor protein 11 isoform C [Alligator mississippiensis]